MFEEEHASESGVDDIRVAMRHADQIESLLSTVTAAPECQ